MHGDEFLEHGPDHRAMERALWALGPALILFMALNIPMIEAARQEAAAELAIAIASESQAYCNKWGMAAGTAEHTDCIRDLVAIRGRTEQRVRHQIAADL